MSVLAFSNLSQIISGIKIPDGSIYLNLDLENPEYMEANIPYYIKNPSVYDLNDLFIKVGVSVNYIDKTNNKNVTFLIFSKSGVLPICKALSSLTGDFKGFFLHFNITAIDNFQLDLDFTKFFRFSVNIEFRANYFLNLVKFSIILNDVDLT